METTNALGCNLAAEVAGKFGRVRLCVSGTSMAPAIHPGDLISVERVSLAEVSPGEIVVFLREGRLIVHRVAAKSESRDEPFLVTRGDRMRRNDAPVTGPELVGRVMHLERGRTRVSAPLRHTFAQQVFCRLLCFSDRATCLYLRLAAL